MTTSVKFHSKLNVTPPFGNLQSFMASAVILSYFITMDEIEGLARLSHNCSRYVCAHKSFLAAHLSPWTWKHIARAKLWTSLTVRFEVPLDRITAVVRNSRERSRCVMSVLNELDKLGGRGLTMGSTLVFVADFVNFRVDLKKLVSSQVDYCWIVVAIGGKQKAIVGMLLDETTKRRTFKNVLDALRDD